MSMQSAVQPPISIRHHLRPGDIGAIIHQHGILYAEEYGFDHTFEPYVAVPLSEFVQAQGDWDRIWIAERGEQMVGTIAIVSVSDQVAQLRWFLVHPDARGIGLGKRLVQDAVDFSRACRYQSVFLWTVNILPVATHLYRSVGFQKTEETAHRMWGVDLIEERYDLILFPSK
jgi:N-acetylglutamate synthase-like GNAT family acetyltransferase